MVLYKKWVDFVIYPFDSNRVQTLEERLNTKNAVDKDRNMPEPNLYLKSIEENGMLVREDLSVGKTDIFEAMEIDDKGNVTIWTKTRVGFVWRIRGEEVHYVRRYPPTE